MTLVDKLATEVAEEFGISEGAIRGKGRMPEVSMARRALFARLHDAGMSAAEIGRQLGKDHSSVLAGIRKHNGGVLRDD